MPRKPRGAVSPHHYLAAITTANGIGNDRHILANVCRVRVLLRALALPVAADQRRTTTADS